MNDEVKCPYCGVEQEINHDDGYGYAEDCHHEQDCVSCERTFEFTTSISFDYSVYCLGGDHELEPFGAKWPDMYQCKHCSYYEYSAGSLKLNN